MEACQRLASYRKRLPDFRRIIDHSDAQALSLQTQVNAAVLYVTTSIVRSRVFRIELIVDVLALFGGLKRMLSTDARHAVVSLPRLGFQNEKTADQRYNGGQVV